jgi:hypothetical protein
MQSTLNGNGQQSGLQRCNDLCLLSLISGATMMTNDEFTDRRDVGGELRMVQGAAFLLRQCLVCVMGKMAGRDDSLSQIPTPDRQMTHFMGLPPRGGHLSPSTPRGDQCLKIPTPNSRA